MKYDPPEFSTAAELGCPFVLDQVRSYYVFCRCIAFLSLLSLLIRKVNITGDLPVLIRNQMYPAVPAAPRLSEFTY